MARRAAAGPGGPDRLLIGELLARIITIRDPASHFLTSCKRLSGLWVTSGLDDFAALGNGDVDA
jgi:hypothetical protein